LRQTSTLSHHTPIAGNILIAAFQNPTATTEVQKDFLATKRKVLNNNRLIKPFTLCFRPAVNREDLLYIEIVEEIGQKLGRQIAGLISIFNPELVIIGGTLSSTGDYIISLSKL
jgi:hypothetical protein